MVRRREFFDLPQFFDGLLRLALNQAADVVHAHGNRRDTLRRPVVQIARQLLTRVFFHLDDLSFSSSKFWYSTAFCSDSVTACR